MIKTFYFTEEIQAVEAYLNACASEVLEILWLDDRFIVYFI